MPSCCNTSYCPLSLSTDSMWAHATNAGMPAAGRRSATSTNESNTAGGTLFLTAAQNSCTTAMVTGGSTSSSALISIKPSGVDPSTRGARNAVISLPYMYHTSSSASTLAHLVVTCTY